MPALRGQRYADRVDGRFQRLILSELKRLNDGLEKLDVRLDKIDLRLTKQEVKAGMWGALAGAATILMAVFLRFLFTGSVR